MKQTILLTLSLSFPCITLGQTVSCGTSFLTSDWNNIGPYQSSSAYMGRVTSIWLDEDDHDADFILAGTRGSGIWKTTDGGDTWSNSTAFQLPAVGVLHIEKYQPIEESRHFYSTISFNGSDRNVYHEGIMYSTDNTSTWNLMDTYPDGYIREGDLLAFGSRKIKLRPSTSDLWVANGKKLFIYDAEDDWKTFGGLPYRFNMDDMTAPFTSPQSIHDIDFAPSDNNIAVVGASSRQWKCLFYTANAGATWNTMLTPSPVTLPTGGFYDITAKSSITADDKVFAFFRILVYNSDGSLLGKEFYLYEYAIVSGAILLDKTYTIISHNPPNYSMFDDIRIEEVGGTRYLFLGQSQRYYYRGVIPAVSGSMSLTEISGVVNSHVDIRSVGYYRNNVGELCAVLGHDGGVSRGDDIVTITTAGWENINGFGLTISEFMGFSSSEFDQYRIAAAGIDGNSYLYLEDPALHTYKVTGGGDAYNHEFSPKEPLYSIFSSNGYGTRNPSFFSAMEITGSATFNSIYKPVYPNSDLTSCINCYSATTDCDLQCGPHNLAFKPYSYTTRSDNTGIDLEYLLAGTTDLYQNVYPYDGDHIQEEWTRLSETSYYIETPQPFNEITYNSITAYAFDDYNEEDNDWTTYFSTYRVRNMGVPGKEDPVKVVRSVVDLSTLGTPFYTSEDITPLITETDAAGSYYQVDESWITCMVNNPDATNELWVGFGANTKGALDRIIDWAMADNDRAKKGRVYFSNNGGDTWINRSDGLPNYPVLCLEYLKGSDDIIFAGTDVGVYVWNKDINQWQCFDTGDQMPYCSISELEINYCTMSLRASTFGFGLWETPLPLGSIYSRAGGQPLEITTDETWTYTRDVGRDIVVKPGATLTIQNCEIRMPKDHRIVVERGAVLKLDNAVLTNHCEPWEGIEVWGNSSKAHPTSAAPVLNGTYPAALDDHGAVLVLNGSRIENAKVAIATQRMTPEGPYLGYNGAIVIAEESEFVNNQTGVQFMPYDFPEIIGGADVENTDDDNISYFDNCSFTTNDKYFHGSHQLYQVYMWDVDGVDILGCDFDNEKTATTLSHLGHGIYSTDATYTVQPAACAYSPCEDSTTFQGYYRGIEAANATSLPLLDVAINKTIFDNNVRGILLSQVEHAVVTENSFHIDNNATIETYGLYLEDCSGYQVEENVFTGDDGGGTAPLSAGIYVANNSNAVTEIYKNTFDGTETGIRSQTVNAKLQIRCNTFLSNIAAFNIAVTSGGLPNQGNCSGGITKPAGNVFSNDNTAAGDYKAQSGVAPFTYRHHTDLDPEHYSVTIITLQDCGIDSEEGEPCPSNLGGGGEEAAAMMMGEANSLDYDIAGLEALTSGYGAEMELGTATYTASVDELAWLQNQQQVLIQEAANSYVLEGKADSAIALLQEQETLWANQQLVGLYINQKDYTAAEALLKALPKTEASVLDFITLQSLVIDIKQSNRNWLNLSEKEVALVQELAGKQSPAGVAAENILQLITGTDHPEVFDIIDGAEELRMAQPGSLLSAISFYPNPASGQLHIDLSAYPVTAQLTIKAINIQGVEVWQVVSTAGSIYTCEVAQWPAGIYLFQVMDGNEVIGTEQVVVE